MALACEQVEGAAAELGRTNVNGPGDLMRLLRFQQIFDGGQPQGATDQDETEDSEDEEAEYHRAQRAQEAADLRLSRTTIWSAELERPASQTGNAPAPSPTVIRRQLPEVCAF